jgi:hypothetical protein
MTIRKIMITTTLPNSIKLELTEFDSHGDSIRVIETRTIGMDMFCTMLKGMVLVEKCALIEFVEMEDTDLDMEK